MTVRLLALKCECGQRATRIREIGFTADHQLVALWRCSGCKRPVSFVKPLSECWRECPAAVSREEKREFNADIIQKFDEEFLKSLRVKLPVEDTPFYWDPPTTI